MRRGGTVEIGVETNRNPYSIYIAHVVDELVAARAGPVSAAAAMAQTHVRQLPIIIRAMNEAGA